MWAFKLRISHVIREQFQSIEELLGATSLLKNTASCTLRLKVFSGLLNEFSLLTYIEDISKVLEIETHSAV